MVSSDAEQPREKGGHSSPWGFQVDQEGIAEVAGRAHGRLGTSGSGPCPEASYLCGLGQVTTPTQVSAAPETFIK